jgi:hypothetical protein
LVSLDAGLATIALRNQRADRKEWCKESECELKTLSCFTELTNMQLFTGIHVNSYEFMAFHGFSWLFMAFHGFSWLFMVIHTTSYEFM